MDQVKEYAPMAQKAVGTLLTAKGERDTGRDADRLARYQAAQMEQNAGQEIAASTVSAEEERRKSALIASRAIAVAAASGGGTLDPTVVKILQGVASEGALASATQLYNGAEKARGLREQAKATRYSGASARAAGKTKALSTLLTGAQSMATTWGGTNDKGPKALNDNESTGAVY
jgi:hypothetical protein